MFQNQRWQAAGMLMRPAADWFSSASLGLLIPHQRRLISTVSSFQLINVKRGGNEEELGKSSPPSNIKMLRFERTRRQQTPFHMCQVTF